MEKEINILLRSSFHQNSLTKMDEKYIIGSISTKQITHDDISLDDIDTVIILLKEREFYRDEFDVTKRIEFLSDPICKLAYKLCKTNQNKNIYKNLIRLRKIG